MGQSASQKMQKTLFDLKMKTKELERQSKKEEKKIKENEKKCKKAMEKGNMEGARIYAQNAIRAKSQSLNFLRLASRMDAVSARVQTAIDMQQLTKSMTGVTKNMDSIMKSMDIERISKVMDKFEEQFEDLDLNAQYMEQAMDSSTAQSMPTSQVDEMMGRIADEHNIELASELHTVNPSIANKQVATEVEPEDDLEARLAKLQGI